MTGLVKRFREEVLRGSLACTIVDEAVQSIVEFYALDDSDSQINTPFRCAFYCEHGKHRSVAIAERVAEKLRLYRVPVEVVHRDVVRSPKQRTKRFKGASRANEWS